MKVNGDAEVAAVVVPNPPNKDGADVVEVPKPPNPVLGAVVVVAPNVKAPKPVVPPAVVVVVPNPPNPVDCVVAGFAPNKDG